MQSRVRREGSLVAMVQASCFGSWTIGWTDTSLGLVSMQSDGYKGMGEAKVLLLGS